MTQSIDLPFEALARVPEAHIEDVIVMRTR